MGVGPRPPQIDLVKALAHDTDIIVFVGINAHDGKPVQIVHTGETEYFGNHKKFKVTFEPILDE